ncbi:hypothetical protein P4S72_27745 [Vibrio sp. PP-XX7]
MDYVDIASTTKEGIYIQDAKNTKVNSGKSRESAELPHSWWEW